MEISNDAIYKDNNGFLRIPTKLASEGVMTYVDAKGNELVGFIPKEEIQKALDTYRGMPLCDDHPPHRLVTPETYKEDSVGFVEKDLRLDDRGVLNGEVVVCEKDAIAAVESEKKVGVSNGYVERKDFTSGVWVDAHDLMGGGKGKEYKYDYVKRDLKFNHLALTATPRNSFAALVLDSADYTLENESSVSLDSADFIQSPNQHSMNTKHISIRGQVVEVVDSSAPILESIATDMKNLDSMRKEYDSMMEKGKKDKEAMDMLKSQMDAMSKEMKAKEDENDSLSGKNLALQTIVDSANDSDSINQKASDEATARLNFWATTQNIATDSFDASLPVAEAKRKYAVSLFPDRKDLETANDGFIDGLLSGLPKGTTPLSTAADSSRQASNTEAPVGDSGMHSAFEAVEGGGWSIRI